VSTGLCVLETVYRSDSDSSSLDVHKYTKHDPTLPRLYIPCPKTDCPTNTKENPLAEVIYMRYNDKAMKYLYRCMTCDYTWKTNDL